jgi:hypothetical protein
MVTALRSRYNIAAPFKGSKLDTFQHLFGVETDSEIARRAGMASTSVYAYRVTHPDLPPSPAKKPQ